MMIQRRNGWTVVEEEEPLLSQEELDIQVSFLTMSPAEIKQRILEDVAQRFDRLQEEDSEHER